MRWRSFTFIAGAGKVASYILKWSCPMRVTRLILLLAVIVSSTPLVAQESSAPASSGVDRPAAARSTRAEANFLGLRVTDLTKEEAAGLGWASPRGAKVVVAVSGGPAAMAGLLPDDIILSLDGRNIENYRDFLFQLRSKAPGTQISLLILRNKQESTISIVLISTTAALAEMERVLTADPNSISAHLAKADLLFRLKRSAEAFAECEQYLKLAPGDGHGFFCRARMSVALDKLDDALNDLNAAVEKLPRLEGPLILRASIFEKRRAFDLAITDLNRALALDEHNVAALTKRGEAYLAKGFTDRAAADFSAALAMNKNNPLAKKGLEEAQAKTTKVVAPETSPGPAPAVPGQTEAPKSATRTDTATSLPKPAGDQIDVDPKLKTEVEQLGAKRDFKRALEVIDRALVQQQSHAGLHNLRGTILLGSGDFNSAVAEFDRAVALQPQFADAHRNRISVKLALPQKLPGALADCDDFIRSLPEMALAYTLRGEVLMQQKKLPEARADLTTAIAKDSNYAAAWIDRGQVYLLEKDYSDAIADLTHAIELNGKSDMAYGLRGKAYLAQKRAELAIPDLQKSLSLNKTNWVALTTLQGLQVAKALEQLGYVKKVRG
jgi:tetratricopeptide (TPR) repeat protein